MAYWQLKGLPKGGKKTQANPYKWCKTTVAKILSQQEYCGGVINFKTYSKSFKNKTRIENDRENWAIFKNVHEPIIEREIFEQVQKKTAQTKRRAPKPENGEKNMFCNYLYCADFKSKLWFHINTVNPKIQYFSSSNYAKDYRGSCQSRHYVRADAIEQVVLLELRNFAKYLRDHEEEFENLLAEKTNEDMAKEQKYLQGELQKATARNAKVAMLYEKLYEDNAEGKVSDEWFMQLSHKFEVEGFELKEKIKGINERLASIAQAAQNKDSFIGHIEIPECDSYKSDTRKGAAVKYLSGGISA